MPTFPARRAVLALPAVIGLVALGACGTTETPAASQPTTAAAAGPVTVTDARGKAVTLPAPATRVVATRVGRGRELVTLGVSPVGVADPKGYATWATAEKLPATVTDVGTRTEPSVDAIVALQPDLVVVEQGHRRGVAAPQLEKYVPVSSPPGSDATRNLGRLRDDFTMIATATGTTAEGDRRPRRDRQDHRRRQGRRSRRRARRGRPWSSPSRYEQGGAPVDPDVTARASLVCRTSARASA